MSASVPKPPVISEIIAEFPKIKIYESRTVTDKRGEVVFFSADTPTWIEILTAHFGPPAKPAGKAPSENDLLVTADFGSINKNQILFRQDYGDSTMIAMFWPWQDNLHTTLKIILGPLKPAASSPPTANPPVNDQGPSTSENKPGMFTKWFGKKPDPS